VCRARQLHTQSLTQALTGDTSDIKRPLLDVYRIRVTVTLDLGLYTFTLRRERNETERRHRSYKTLLTLIDEYTAGIDLFVD